MHHFGVSGLLWNRNLVMYDAETDSLWSHLLGEAMQGELKGTKLEMLPSEMTTWRAWQRDHPDTTVLNLSRTSQDFTKEFYTDPSSFVYGWSLALQPYHYPLDAAAKQPILNLTLGKAALTLAFDPDGPEVGLFSRKLGDRELSFVATRPGRMRDEQTGSIWNASTGVALEGPLKGQRLERQLGMFAYSRAWLTFHPRSQSVPLK